MALTVTVEDGTGLAAANSYISRANADSYFERHLHKGTWTGSTQTTKNAGVVMATRLIDDYFAFVGTKVGTTQALEFPRFGVEDRSGNTLTATTLPNELVEATAELAQFLIASDRAADPEGIGFEKLKVGNLELVPDRNNTVQVIPNIVTMMLLSISTKRGGATLRVAR